MKWPYTSLQSLQLQLEKSLANEGTLWKTLSSIFSEPGIHHSVLAVDPEAALELSSSPSQTVFRASWAHPGIYPVIRQELSQGLVGTIPIVYLVIGQWSEVPTLNPEAGPCPRATLLNKILEAVLFTQEQTGSMSTSAPINKSVNFRSKYRCSNNLISWF